AAPEAGGNAPARTTEKEERKRAHQRRPQRDRGFEGSGRIEPDGGEHEKRGGRCADREDSTARTAQEGEKNEPGADEEESDRRQRELSDSQARPVEARKGAVDVAKLRRHREKREPALPAQRRKGRAGRDRRVGEGRRRERDTHSAELPATSRERSRYQDERGRGEADLGPARQRGEEAYGREDVVRPTGIRHEQQRPGRG